MNLSFGDVVALLIYLVPGFLALELVASKYPVKKKTQYAALIWSMIHSLAILVLLSAVSRVLKDPTLDFLSKEASKTLNSGSVLLLLLAGLCWGCLLLALRWVRSKATFLRDPDLQAVWPWVATMAPKHQLWALARTKSGMRYLGWIKRFTFDPDNQDHDFLLQPAFAVDEKLAAIHEGRNGGVYLNTRDIESVEFLPGS